MDRARRPTVEVFSQNLHATHTSGGPYVAAELRGDGPGCGAPCLCEGHRGRESPNGETLG
eukprot:3405241-Prymnesium_polylepis.1